MSRPKLPWTFERLRKLAYQRHKAQALYRKEGFDITEEYWNEIWTEDRFHRRGMKAEDICLTRRDHNKPWTKGNLCLMLRQQQLQINSKVIHGIPTEHIYENTIWRDYV